MNAPTKSHTPTKIGYHEQSEDQISVCADCGKDIVKNFYPAEYGERNAEYSRYWADKTRIPGKSADVWIYLANYECGKDNA